MRGGPEPRSVCILAADVQDRPRRITYSVAPNSGKVTAVSDFAGQNIVDQIVAVTTATHEGQLFGRFNQALLLATAASLILVTISGALMWWRRRPAGVLGAPAPAAHPRFAPAHAASIILLALLLPLFGASLLLMLVIDSTLLPLVPGAQRWLGRGQLGGSHGSNVSRAQQP